MVTITLPALSYDAQTLKELSPRCGSVGYYESVALYYPLYTGLAHYLSNIAALDVVEGQHFSHSQSKEVGS